ncbi:carboxymuconolactone decarboxylase family protein [Chitinophaga silvisoli]|uniref:Carboxymuconolactone decarboxylase family protein n=1 Tax=Chitinophaga silvisoli TaxID=2291814 RepID=A0A3E1PAA2_9BACT|nr:carboxymuconolactone decarboxylase family protein [Chitinophaga silvisoli]RFM37113.1 carboxymuconolactone decarboxylase family protein [Chitinophaga silvisoli]
MDYKQIAQQTVGHLYKAHSSIRTSGIDPLLIALVELRVSQINGCAYCCHFHAGELREMGMPAAIVDQIPGFRHSKDFSLQQRLVLQYAEDVVGLKGDVQLLSAHFSEREIVELTASIALMGALNRLRMILADK